jgi:hypothetical protein
MSQQSAAAAMSILCVVITVTTVLCASLFTRSNATNIDGETDPFHVLTNFILFLSVPLLQIFATMLEMRKVGAPSHGRTLRSSANEEMANKSVVSLRACALTGWAFLCFFLILKDE